MKCASTRMNVLYSNFAVSSVNKVFTIIEVDFDFGVKKIDLFL